MRPLCVCHGEAMRKNTDSRYRGGFYWRCAVRNREHCAAYYDRMPFAVRAKRGLYQRRYFGLKRRRERQLRRAEP